MLVGLFMSERQMRIYLEGDHFLAEESQYI